MTLDHGCKPTIKGHFCSLLISNIFCVSSLSMIYLLLRFTTRNLQIQIIKFFNENTVLRFVCVASKGERLIFSQVPCKIPRGSLFTHVLGSLGKIRS